jgi:hypothetical protein
MSDEQIHIALINKLRQEHAFWSYDETSIVKLSDERLIAEVLLHLDIDDIQNLFKIYPKRMIQKVWKDKMLSQEPMYHGLNKFYAWFFFNIKDTERYIRYYKNKRYKSILCKD